jgi:hypothetical protein
LEHRPSDFVNDHGANIVDRKREKRTAVTGFKRRVDVTIRDRHIRIGF